jgi:hypothetical protein
MTTRTASGALGLIAAATVALVAALLLATSVSAAGNESLTAVPSSTSLNQNQVFTVDVMMNADVVTTGTQTDVCFDKTRLQVTDVVLGPDWTASQFIIGVAPNNTKPLAIADANASGCLQNVTGYYSPGSGSVPTGSRLFAKVTMTSLTNGGSSDITLADIHAIDTAGASLSMTHTDTSVLVDGPISVGGIVETVVPHDGGSSLSILAIIAGVTAAAAALGMLGFGARFVGRRTRSI